MNGIIENLKQLKAQQESSGCNMNTQFKVGYVKAINDAINLIQENDDWVSVNEQLPDIDSEVLTYRDSFKNGELYIHCVYTKTGFIDYKTGLLIKQPSHWQPLPNSPK